MKHLIFILLLLLIVPQVKAGGFGAFDDAIGVGTAPCLEDTLAGTPFTCDSTGILDSMKMRIKSYGFGVDDYWRGEVHAYPTKSFLVATDSVLVEDNVQDQTIVLTFPGTDTVYVDSQYILSAIGNQTDQNRFMGKIASANDTIFIDPASMASPGTFVPIDTIADTCVNISCYTTYLDLSAKGQVIMIMGN